MKINWLILTATLPTTLSGLRVRVWSALKATGAGTLREGVYVLPQHAVSAPKVWEIERTISQAGADAHMLVLQARDDAHPRRRGAWIRDAHSRPASPHANDAAFYFALQAAHEK